VFEEKPEEAGQDTQSLCGCKRKGHTSQISGKEESQQEEHGALLTPRASFYRTALVATGTWNGYNLTWNERRCSQPRMTSSGEL